MIPAIIESPYGGTPEEVERNVLYARRCMLWALQQGYAPFLSHLLYTQVLDDDIPEERTLGIEAGLAWGAGARITVVCEDYGITKGMRQGIKAAKLAGRRVIRERIGPNALGASSIREHEAIYALTSDIQRAEDQRALAEVVTIKKKP